MINAIYKHILQELALSANSFMGKLGKAIGKELPWLGVWWWYIDCSFQTGPWMNMISWVLHCTSFPGISHRLEIGVECNNTKLSHPFLRRLGFQTLYHLGIHACQCIYLLSLRPKTQSRQLLLSKALLVMILIHADWINWPPAFDFEHKQWKAFLSFSHIHSVSFHQQEVISSGTTLIK